jgi:transposase
LIRDIQPFALAAQKWCARVTTLGNAPLQKVAAMFERYWSGIAVYIEHRVTNATAESLNTKFSYSKRRHRAFAPRAAFASQSYFTWDNLICTHTNHASASSLDC